MRALTVCQGTVPADYYDAWIDEVLSDNRLVKVVLKWLMYIIIINLKTVSEGRCGSLLCLQNCRVVNSSVRITCLQIVLCLNSESQPFLCRDSSRNATMYFIKVLFTFRIHVCIDSCTVLSVALLLCCKVVQLITVLTLRSVYISIATRIQYYFL